MVYSSLLENFLLEHLQSDSCKKFRKPRLTEHSQVSSFNNCKKYSSFVFKMWNKNTTASSTCFEQKNSFVFQSFRCCFNDLHVEDSIDLLAYIVFVYFEIHPTIVAIFIIRVIRIIFSRINACIGLVNMRKEIITISITILKTFTVDSKLAQFTPAINAK